MSVFDGFFAMGGNEIVNSARAMAYARTADCPMGWLKGDTCATTADALGSEEYTYSAIETAPWYDPALADVSSRFFGCFGIDIGGGLDSTRKATATQSIVDGGTLSMVRKGTKEMRVRALLAGRGMDAIEYGMSWLSAALDPGTCGQHGGRCGTTDVEWWSTCPPERSIIRGNTDWETQRTNLVPNPNLQDGTLGRLVSTAEPPEIADVDGRQAWVLPWVNGGAVMYLFGNDSGGNIPISGPTASFSADLYRASDGDCALFALFYDENNANVSTWTTAHIAIPGGEWTTVSGADIPVPEEAVSALFFINFYAASDELMAASRLLVENTGTVGSYFDGDSTPSNADLQRYLWDDDGVSLYQTRERYQRPQTDEEYAESVAPVRRFLHDAACVSGPLVQETYSSGPFDAYVVEFTIDSERAFVYGVTESVDLPTTASQVVQDITYNLAPYPSMELASGNVVIARNLATNPSVESNATGWLNSVQTISGANPTTYFTAARSTDLAAVGNASYRGRILGNGSTSVAGAQARIFLSQDVTVGSLNADRISVSIWGAAVISEGLLASSITSLTSKVEWRDGSTIVGSTPLGEADASEFAGHVFSEASIPIPEDAVTARVQVIAEVGWGSSSNSSNNSDVRVYADALAVTVP